MVGRVTVALLLGLWSGTLAREASGQESIWWRQDSLFQRIAAELDTVSAIDGHTHLTRFVPFSVAGDVAPPIGGRSMSDAAIRKALVSRFGVDLREDIEQIAGRVEAIRKQEMRKFGPTEYWHRHLDRTRTSIALVNDNFVDGLDHVRLRWVPSATTLLFPLPGEGFLRPGADPRNLERIQSHLMRFLAHAGYDAIPTTLAAYLDAVDEVLMDWKDRDAVAVKFFDAYMRTLEFADVPSDVASELFEAGLSRTLERTEYLAVQDHIARHIFLQAGRLQVPVHIHSSSGRPPFLRLGEADVRNLESVLADPQFFDTQFVLIHGGFPLTFEASYLTAKPNVWVDVSAMGWYSPPDLAPILRTFVLGNPARILFGTDAAVFPGVPGGAEVAHLARSEVTREALYLALAGIVRDGVIGLDKAITFGRWVLADNARRLYKW